MALRMNPKCRYCQHAIRLDLEEPLTIYAGHDFHRDCFETWARNRLERLERKLRERGLNERELHDLQEFREIVGL